MNANKPVRETPWRIGSFTKNFSWGKPDSGFRRLHAAINIGFGEELKPVPRRVFWERLQRAGFVPHIPANFFVFNGILNGENFIFPDELVFQALSSKHNRNFDKLTFFTLLLSESGNWKGARAGQSQPSEWARYLFLERAQEFDAWKTGHFSADKIESFLRNESRFEGGTGTRKLATNLSYFFSLANIERFPEEDDLNWVSDSIFLALDRYFMIKWPDDFGLEWALNTLFENEIVSLSGPFESNFLEYDDVTARLYIESKGLDRLEGGAKKTVLGVISREPLIYKALPEIVANWLTNRLFVEIVQKENIDELRDFDASKFYAGALQKLHNQVPKPSISGDKFLALVRPQHDDS